MELEGGGWGRFSRDEWMRREGRLSGRMYRAHMHTRAPLALMVMLLALCV